MERQPSEDEICSTAIFCGVGESFLRVIVPRTPSRCCSGSTRIFKSYFEKVRASRSRENEFAAAAKNKQRKHSRALRNFISHPRRPFFFYPLPASAAQFHTSPPLPRPTHSAKALSPALESKPENRISS